MIYFLEVNDFVIRMHIWTTKNEFGLNPIFYASTLICRYSGFCVLKVVLENHRYSTYASSFQKIIRTFQWWLTKLNTRPKYVLDFVIFTKLGCLISMRNGKIPQPALYRQLSHRHTWSWFWTRFHLKSQSFGKWCRYVLMLVKKGVNNAKSSLFIDQKKQKTRPNAGIAGISFRSAVSFLLNSLAIWNGAISPIIHTQNNR